ncbi:MAG: DinB family protein [Deinococcales bacterium]|nr:DinB family protein [Deinococcales bacterium]
MSLIQRLIGAALRPHVRRRARGRSLEELIRSLEEFGARLDERIARAADTPGNREAVDHWVGIERWSQSRLRVARGAAFQLDAYHGYREPDGASLDHLRQAMRATRAATVALAREMQREGFDPALTVRHNDLGELTVLEWFAYIDDHTRREVIRLRGTR